MSSKKEFDLGNIRGRLESNLRYAKEVERIWKEVTFPTKKDGTPFANMSRNFRGAHYERDPYSISSYPVYLLKVYGHGGVSDYISCNVPVKYMNDAEMLAKTQNYLPKERYVEQLYNFDIDDIKAAVKERIERAERDVEELERDFELCEEGYDMFSCAYDKACLELKKMMLDGKKSSTSQAYYDIIRTVTGRI